MACPRCKSGNSRVIRTQYRKTDGRTIRVRICRSCGSQYSEAPRLRARADAVTRWGQGGS